ncbi:MAG: hypothetical protein C0606_09160 [Hyphomicrobiales bacterium]|nr:MAG: hypothetical protein C0606_09160 [Hyphomicrobiales bacterium]
MKDDVIAWNSLDEAAQTRLRMEHQAWLDTQPPTCSLDAKTARFTSWLAERGVDFDLERDLPGAAKRTPAFGAVNGRD